MQRDCSGIRRAQKLPVGSRAWLAVLALGALAACSDTGPVAPLRPTSPNESVEGASGFFIPPYLRFAYLWANQSTAAIGVPYTPSTAYSYNRMSKPNSATHTGTGSYTVRLGGMFKPGFAEPETFIVTPYGSSSRCTVGGWGNVNFDMQVSVNCVNTVGAAADAQFTLLMVSNLSLPGRHAFAWADQPFAASYTPSVDYSFTSSHLTSPPMVMSRSSVGTYNADLKSPRPAGGPPETYLVTAYGSTDHQCSIGSWGTTASVRCYSRAGGGAPADSKYDILTATLGFPGLRAGFAWANSPGSASYTPNTSYSYSSSGGLITITRSGVGTYKVNFAGLQKLPGHTENVQISGYGSGFRTCAIGNWLNSANGLSVNLSCRDVKGALVDSFYTILVFE